MISMPHTLLCPREAAVAVVVVTVTIFNHSYYWSIGQHSLFGSKGTEFVQDMMKRSKLTILRTLEAYVCNC